MAVSAKNLEPAFQGAGQKVGMEIWCIENFQPVPLPKSDHGKFYSGDSYIILQTSPGKGGAYLYDIYFWIGKDTSQDEAGTAAIKTVELDAILGGRAVQHRELQGHESDKFLSYFRPCIIPLEGGVASGFKKPEEEKFETRLYVCKGKRAVRLKQVPFARSSLNHDDVFILDTENKIFQFNGANSNIQERAKSLEVIQYLKEKYHKGTCEVAIIDDGRLEAESGSGEFWVLFGGFAPIGRKTISEDDVTLETTPGKLYSINDGQLKLEDSTLTKAMLENTKCYLLDCGAEIFVWVGRITQVDDRKSACKTAEELIANENRPKTTRIIRVIQGFETHSFKSNFESWPASTGTATSTGEEGRGKVAALLKQQGVDIKGTSKSSPVIEEIPPLLEGGGKLEVWRINGSAKTPIQQEDIGKFYSGDCYIVLYTYHSGEKKEEYFLNCWMGKDSIQDDQIMATRLANTMCNSLKGRPVLGRIFQGRESPQFIALFQPMVVLKGGISSGYKKYIAEKSLTDDTYTSDGIALFRVSGTSAHNNKAVQVDAVATSLCSADCFLLQSGNSLFNWHGSSSTFEQQQWATKLGELLKPGAVLKHAKEGTESSAFWFALGGKQSFTTKKVTQETVRDPHMYTFSLKNGKLQVSEVFNFFQDDLLTEDMLILDTHAEVFVWVGNSVASKEKQEALNIGQKYIELAAALEGLSPDVPLYKITEGNEPCFFTTYFAWDGTKSSVKGNSFQKKLSLLFGTVLPASEYNDRSNNSNQGGSTQRAEALAALNSAFNPSNNTRGKSYSLSQGGATQRAEALAALTSAFNPSNNSKSKSYNLNQGGHTQRAEALTALTSAFNPSSKEKSTVPKPPVRSTQGSQRAAAVAALSTVLTAEQMREQSEAAKGQLSRGSSMNLTLTDEVNSEPASPEMGDPVDSSEAGDTVVTSAEEDVGEEGSISENNGAEAEEKYDSKIVDETKGGERQTFSYDRLKSKSSNPVKGIDYKRREVKVYKLEPLPPSKIIGDWIDTSRNLNFWVEILGVSQLQRASYTQKLRISRLLETYLSEAEFGTVFGLTKEAFYKQPKWKQDLQKRKLDLF